MATHALNASNEPFALRALKYLDLVVLAIALPIFVAAGLPVLGWAAAAVGWIAQRVIAELANRKAKASNDPRAVAGLLTGSLIGRGWLVALTIFGAGMIEREAGLSAGVLSIALFTVWFTTQMATRPFEMGGPRK